MEIRFQTEITEKFSTCLAISKIDSGVFISILKINAVNNSEELIENHFLNKEELKDFIGALLHVQSKLNK
jgi:hypothetical protein